MRTTTVLLLAALALPAPLAAQSRSDAQTGEMLVSTEWLAGRLNDPGVVVIHVADRRETYDRGHIPGARFLEYGKIATEVGGVPVELPPVAQLEEALEAVGASDGARIVVVGHPMSAARVWATLDHLGHGGHTSVLDGGLDVWRAEGRPVTQEEPPAARGALTPRVQPERFVDAEWVRGHLNDPRHALIDARPHAEYATAAGAHGGQLAEGHVPGARNLYWEELIVSRERPVFKSRDELRALYRAAGADEGDTVVAYCFIGMRASVAYFVGRLLGYETKLYDGSWVDWSARRLPTETGDGGAR